MPIIEEHSAYIAQERMLKAYDGVQEESLPLERFNEWVHCICVVTFDLELGQTIEMMYPGSSRLSPAEKLQICYLSFPDSNNNSSRDSLYHFRVKCSPQLSDCKNHSNFESFIPLPLRSFSGYLFGFVFFRQEKDSSLPRGYFQKSVVLLSHFPLFQLHYYILRYIASEFFQFGANVIEKACQDIDHWPFPEANKILVLQLLNSIIRCKIPLRYDAFSHQIFFEFRKITSSMATPFCTIIQETSFYESMRDLLPHIQHLWELVILGEPILAMAQTPTQCSRLVQSLTWLIWPLKYANDYRPYFTIHDTEFNEISLKIQPPNMIIGVTNPFFFKSLKHWPHILRLGDINCTTQDIATRPKKSLKKLDNGKKIESKPGFYSQYKPFLNFDKSLLKKLLKIGERPDNIQNEIFRRHFIELTQNFMIPLERYVMSFMPLEKEINPFKPLPIMKSFSMDDFLSELNRSNTFLKGDLRGLYKTFITKSANFREWLSLRIQEMDERLRSAHTEMLSTAVLSTQSLACCNQVEIVDLVLRLKEKLEVSVLEEDQRRIRRQLQNIIKSIDDELKSVFMSSEALRDIFASL